VPAALAMVTVQLAVALPVMTNAVPGEPVIVSEPAGQVLVTEAGPSADGIEIASDLPTVSASAFFAPSGTGDAVIASAEPEPSGATGVPDPPPLHAATETVAAKTRTPAPIRFRLGDTIRRPA
jgi:hypothetical protein